MSYVLSPAELEARARAAGLSVADMCSRAEISVSTFSRWRAGRTQPTLGVYERLCRAVEHLPVSPGVQSQAT